MRPTVAISFVLAQAVNAFAFSASAQDLRGMATAEAIDVFDKVCGKTVPDFSNAEANAKALGFAFNEADPVKDLTIEVKKSTSGEPFCTVHFGTNEQIPEIIRQLQVGLDLGIGIDPESYAKPAPVPRSIKFVDKGYRDTDYLARIYTDHVRKYGRYKVTMHLWGEK